ncbi:MAG: hypothetical protein U9Q69_04620 [Nanoarchaeota archaeon]|nr:hypothetical protein [Nanoarchaeota archaeon]
MVIFDKEKTKLLEEICRSCLGIFNKPFSFNFLDVGLYVPSGMETKNISIPHMWYDIMHRLPDDEFPKGQIFLNISLDSPLIKTEAFTKKFPQDIERITGAIKYFRKKYQNYGFEPIRAITIPQVINWMNEYRQLDYVDEVIFQVR